MQIETTKKPGSQIELVFSLSEEEYYKIKNQAAINVSQKHKIAGFREGKAPYEVIVKQLGKEVLQDEELILAVRRYYLPYLAEHNLEVVGKPEVKLVNSSPFVFTVISPLLPEVNLGQWEKIKLNHRPIKVVTGEVDKVINDLRNSRASEALVDREAKLGDLVKLDWQIAVDGVSIDGGQGKDYSVILGQGNLLPGFEDNLVGLKTGQSKEFEVTFPQNYQKHLAGKQGKVQTKIKAVYERTLPELTDEFAKLLGRFTSVSDLRAKIKANLEKEAQVAEEDRLERELFEEFLKIATITDIPKILITNETEKMIEELTHAVEQNGLEFSEYLKSLGKTKEQLKQEFKEQAIKRIKTALIIRKLSQQYNLVVDDKVVDEQIAVATQYLQDNDIRHDYFNSADYRDYVKNVLTNRLVVEWLKDKLVAKE